MPQFHLFLTSLHPKVVYSLVYQAPLFLLSFRKVPLRTFLVGLAAGYTTLESPSLRKDLSLVVASLMTAPRS